MNDNWTSHDDDNDGVASQTTSSSTRGQQLATGEYCWTESIKMPSPHLKLYANLPQIQSLNLMTAPAFAAPLRVLQHKQINIMIDLVNFTIICNSSTKENYIFISCIFNQLYMTHVHGSSCTLPSIYVSWYCIQSLCWINIHISKDSFPGFLQVLLRPFIVLLNIIVPGWNWTSVINRRKFVVDCAVVEVPKDLRLDLKKCVLLKSDKSPHSWYTISTLTTNLTEAFIVSEVQSALLSMSTPFLPPNSRQLWSPGRPN